VPVANHLPAHEGGGLVEANQVHRAAAHPGLNAAWSASSSVRDRSGSTGKIPMSTSLSARRVPLAAEPNSMAKRSGGPDFKTAARSRRGRAVTVIAPVQNSAPVAHGGRVWR
jgi:hypothetical protein